MAVAWLYYLSSFFYFLTVSNQEITCPFDSIYQIGDSTSDTGNLIRVPSVGPIVPAARLPYGETFPGSPTGRWSDGRLIIDYIAMKLGLPLLNPYLNGNASFNNGVNFAVAGATALNTSFLAARGVVVPSIFTPLSGQLDWLRRYLNSVCSTPSECSNRLKTALIVLGDIGNNDIDYGLSQKRTLEEIRAYVPFIPQAIANATREIIRLGATKIVVPGTFPLGCLPINLVLFPNGAKDDQGCLKNINELSVYFNNLLQKALTLLRLEFPSVIIIYADYYNAFQYIFRNAPALGFDRTTLLKACCGAGGQYNFDKNRSCGSAGVPVCPNPARYIQWDGDHLTQEAHRHISEFLIPQILAKLHSSPEL